jgi:hypothetical protein
MERRNLPQAMNDQATRPPRRTYEERRKVVQRKFSPDSIRDPKMTHRQPPHRTPGSNPAAAGATVNEDSLPVPK